MVLKQARVGIYCQNGKVSTRCAHRTPMYSPRPPHADAAADPPLASHLPHASAVVGLSTCGSRLLQAGLINNILNILRSVILGSVILGSVILGSEILGSEILGSWEILRNTEKY